MKKFFLTNAESAIFTELQPGFLVPNKEFEIEGDDDFMPTLVVKTKFTHVTCFLVIFYWIVSKCY